MKTGLIILFSGLVLVAGFAGCGTKEEAPEETIEEIKGSQVPNIPDSMRVEMDSLAAAEHPIRNPEHKFVTLETNFGAMTLELYADVAPAHADSFYSRSSEGFYDSTLFFRIIKSFMIQGGDPLNNGTGNAGYYLQAEFNELPHKDGTLSMARSSDPNSASCQFFVCLGRNSGTQSLDNKYTVFGQLIKGYDVLHSIGSVECQANPHNPREISSPLEPVVLIKAYPSDAGGNAL